MRTTTHRIGTAVIALALGLTGAACESDDGTTDGGTEQATTDSTVEDIVEETADEADELGTTPESNTGDDVGDESPGEG